MDKTTPVELLHGLQSQKDRLESDWKRVCDEDGHSPLFRQKLVEILEKGCPHYEECFRAIRKAGLMNPANAELLENHREFLEDLVLFLGGRSLSSESIRIVYECLSYPDGFAGEEPLSSENGLRWWLRDMTSKLSRVWGNVCDQEEEESNPLLIRVLEEGLQRYEECFQAVGKADMMDSANAELLEKHREFLQGLAFFLGKKIVSGHLEDLPDSVRSDGHVSQDGFCRRVMEFELPRTLLFTEIFSGRPRLCKSVSGI